MDGRSDRYRLAHGLCQATSSGTTVLGGWSRGCFLAQVWGYNLVREQVVISGCKPFPLQWAHFGIKLIYILYLVSVITTLPETNIASENGPSQKENPSKMDYLGVFPYFWKHPNVAQKTVLFGPVSFREFFHFLAKHCCSTPSCWTGSPYDWVGLRNHRCRSHRPGQVQLGVNPK